MRNKEIRDEPRSYVGKMAADPGILAENLIGSLVLSSYGEPIANFCKSFTSNSRPKHVDMIEFSHMVLSVHNIATKIRK